MGTKERRERERKEIRTTILDAAREMFIAEGYEAVTMRKIADRIEYSPTAIYFHFKDKDALIHELCDADFEALAHEFAGIARIADPIEQIRRIGHAYADFGLRNPNHYRLMFMTPHPPYSPADSRIQQGNPEEDAYAFLTQVVALAIEQGRLRPELKDPDLVSQTLWGAVHGAVSLQIAKQNDPWIDWKPLKKRVSLMIDAVIRGIERE
ncbi:MAG TPA: TetR/AcrR family transcriptional regulator [Thermoanaerobaculia bacterium]